MLGACFVFGCPELTGTGATCHAVDRECALLLELSRKRPLQHSLTQTRAFGRPQTPTTQRHRWRTLRRAHSNTRHSQSAVRWLRASSRDCATGLFHTVLVVRVLFALSKSFLDDSQNPGPRALSLIKHTYVHAFCDL